MTINRNMEVLLGTISIDRILSFNPTISHYWREHAPRRRNLPPELSIKDTYNDYKQKYGSVVGYNKYRKIVKELHISFAKLGEEEYETCMYYDRHEHDNPDALQCIICEAWRLHGKKAMKSRRA